MLSVYTVTIPSPTCFKSSLPSAGSHTNIENLIKPVTYKFYRNNQQDATM